MSSENPQPGDTIRLTGTFDLNVDLPEDIKIFVKTFETTADDTPLANFRVTTPEQTIDLSKVVSLEVDTATDSAPEDFTVEFTVDDPEVTFIETEPTNSIGVSFPDKYDGAIRSATVTATGKSSTTSDVISSVVLSAESSLGILSDVTLQDTFNGTFAIDNGQSSIYSAVNSGNAQPANLDYYWSSSEGPGIFVATDGEVTSDNTYYVNGSSSVGIVPTGITDTDIAISCTVVAKDRVYGEDQLVEGTLTVGTVSNPDKLTNIGDVSITAFIPPGGIDNFSTRTFNASITGNATGATYLWTTDDPLAIIEPSGSSADITFQSPDRETTVTCSVNSAGSFDSPKTSIFALTVGTPGEVYIPVEGDLIAPGSGFTGVTSTPPAQGSPSDIGYEFPPVGRFVSPLYDDHVQGDGKINIYLAAAHRDDIKHVDFILDGGTAIRVTEPTYVPVYEAELYVISVDIDAIPEKELYEMRAIVTPNIGQCLVLQGETSESRPNINGEDYVGNNLSGLHGFFFHKINANKREVVYCDIANGIDSTTQADGSPENPYRTPEFAHFYGLANGIKSTYMDYKTLVLMGDHDYTLKNLGDPYNSLRSNAGWFNIVGEDPNNRPTILIEDRRDGFSPQRVRMKDVKFLSTELAGSVSDCAMSGFTTGQGMIWLENIEHNQDFITSSIANGRNRYRFTRGSKGIRTKGTSLGKGTGVNNVIEGCIGDAIGFTASFNTLIKDQGPYFPEFNSDEHLDMWQPYVRDHVLTNYILHGLFARERNFCQGIYFNGGSTRFQNFWIKNCEICHLNTELDGSEGPPLFRDFPNFPKPFFGYKDTLHFIVEECAIDDMWWSCTLDPVNFPPGSVDPNGDTLPTLRGTVVRNSFKSYDTSTKLLCYPDRYSGGRGGFYYEEGEPPFPWESPSTEIVYINEDYVDYLETVYIQEGGAIIDGSFEITPSSKTFTARAITDQDENTLQYLWTVTASDGDTSGVTATTGTNSTFVFEVTVPDLSRTYTVSCQVTAPTIGESVTSSVSYTVRPPLAFPITIEGLAQDVGGNAFDWSADSSDATWTDANGNDVAPLSFTGLRIKSYNTGLRLNFNDMSQLEDRFLGEYAGKNLKLTFNNNSTDLDGVITNGVNTIVDTDNGVPFVRFPTNQGNNAWVNDSFPFTSSNNGGTRPFKIEFTSP